MPRTIYEPVPSKTILNPVKAPSIPFRWSINPYRGCQHGCSFCYARATHTFLGVEADDTFQHHIFLKSSAPDALRQQLDKAARSKGGISKLGYVGIGTATDPYQPIESKEKLTRGCLEALADYGVPVSITTRSPLILRDIDVLRRLPSCTVNISVNTLDPYIWRSLEPATPFPAKRLDTVKQLNNASIRSGVFVAPIMPYMTDDQAGLSRLIEAIAESRAAFVMSSFLRLSTSEVKVWFFRTLEQSFPHLVRRYADLYAGSGYTPTYYREPIQRYINELLNRHGIPGMEAFRRKEETIQAEAEGVSDAPVQLSFSF